MPYMKMWPELVHFTAPTLIRWVGGKPSLKDHLACFKQAMVKLQGMAVRKFSNVYFGENHTPLMKKGLAAIPKRRHTLLIVPFIF